jgi:hypothetical protein
MNLIELLANTESKGHITQYFGIREKEYQVVEVKIRRRNVLHLYLPQLLPKEGDLQRTL